MKTVASIQNRDSNHSSYKVVFVNSSLQCTSSKSETKGKKNKNLKKMRKRKHNKTLKPGRGRLIN